MANLCSSMSIADDNGVNYRVARLSLYALITAMSVGLLQSSYELVYYAIAFCVVAFTGYLFVRDDKMIPQLVVGSNILFVQISTYKYLTDTDFSFYGLELIFSIVVGILLLITVNFVMTIVMVPIIYGDFTTYSDVLEERKMSQNEDPYGDEHAQEILDN